MENDTLRVSLVLAAVTTVLTAGCGSGSGSRACSVASIHSRPNVHLAWEVDHPSMDIEPLRPRITLIVRRDGTKNERIALGEFLGVCKLVELGAPPPKPIYGGVVGEVRCTQGTLASHGRVVHASATEIVVRRFETGGIAGDSSGWEPGDAPAVDSKQLKNVRDVATLEVPECAIFTSEIAHPDKL